VRKSVLPDDDLVHPVGIAKANFHHYPFPNEGEGREQYLPTEVAIFGPE
jgi:hypothetical protein